MTTQHKAHGRASSMPWGLAAGAAVSTVVTMMICMIGAWLIGAEIMSQQQIGYCSILALLMGAILGAITAWKKIQRQKLMVCLLSGGVYYAILAAITIVFFDGGFQGMGVTFVTVLIGCAAAVLLTNTEQKQKSIKKRKKYTGKLYRN